MLLEIVKRKATYVDKKTGEQKRTYHYYLITPSGRGIQIRNAFKEDSGKMDVLIPLAEEKVEKAETEAK